MHRDHKLGLALGVLVVGFAAALCFPKQTDIDQRLLQLENTAELDADIARLPVHAYTDADLPAAPQPPAASTPDAAPEFGPVASVPGNSEFELLAGPPAPISPDPAPETAPTANDLDHEATAEAASAIPDTQRAATSATAPPTGGPHYIVQPGDTLSSLAAQYLGSHSRYVELFDANREILATPDDLEPGMVLTIPGATAGENLVVAEEGRSTAEPEFIIPDIAPQAPTPEVPATAQPAPTSAARPRLFRPVRSQPFLKAQPVSRDTGAPLPTMDATPGTPAADVPARDTADTYTVRRGDTLESIAIKAYGDARRVNDLLQANQATVRDPRRLRPGMKLTLPPAP